MTIIKPTHKNNKLSANSSANTERSLAVNLMAHLVVPTFVLDAECRVLIWNHACERLTGIPATELIGTSNHWQAFYKNKRDCLADLIAQHRVNEVSEFYIEHGNNTEPSYSLYAENWCFIPRMGVRRYLAIDAGAIYSDDGELIAVVETVRDMTLQKEAQTALQELANRDGLTGLANRRRFDDVLNAEWRRGTRSLQAISVLMIDVDYFKHYNDTYGHLKGDECLRTIGKIMGTIINRASDLVARYGGEEFVVILPGSSIEGAKVVSENIRAAIENLVLPHEYNDQKCITVSIGAACTFASRETDPAQLLAAADAALYRAKEAGRNRVVLQTETGSE